jgi:hypothetical protein
MKIKLPLHDGRHCCTAQRKAKVELVGPATSMGALVTKNLLFYGCTLLARMHTAADSGGKRKTILKLVHTVPCMFGYGFASLIVFDNLLYLFLLFLLLSFTGFNHDKYSTYKTLC